MDDNTSLQSVKSWYSALNTLHISPRSTASNRISPLISTKRLSSSLAVKKPAQITTTTSASITHMLKRMTRTPTLTRSNSSNVSKLLSKKRGQHHPHNEGVRIYMKSPHAIASGQLSGTLVLQSPLDDSFQSIQLSLTGTEEVIKAGDHEGARHSFLNLKVLCMTADQTGLLSDDAQDTDNDVVEIPFSVLLSPHLCGSFEDSKIGSIKYHLKSEIKFNDDKETLVTKTPVLIYPNYASEIHNLPISKSNIEVWRSTSDNSFVTMDLSLSRSIWTAGNPIHITINIQNNSEHTVRDVKLELVRKQSTFSKEVMPDTAIYDTVSETSLSNSGWWYPLKPDRRDSITLAVQTLLNQTTVTGENLMTVSYFVRVLISSGERTDTVAELPIILAHAISMDPPSSLLSTEEYWRVKDIPQITLCEDAEVSNDKRNTDNQFIESSDAKKESMDDEYDLSVHTLDNSQRAALSDIIEVDTPVSNHLPDLYPLNSSFSETIVSSTSSINEILTLKAASLTLDIGPRGNNNHSSTSMPRPLITSSSVASSLYSTTNLASNQTEDNQLDPLKRHHTISSNKLSKMKKSLSSWGTLISRKISLSKSGTRSSSGNRTSSRPTISAPIIISDHTLSSCDDSPASSLKSSPESGKGDIINIINRSSREFQPQRSIMKFGQIKGPKRFGQQPGSLGDAGLDIRKCFNVATATEAIKSFSAEKVEIPDDIPFFSCSGSSASSSCNDEDDDIEALNDEPSEAQFYVEPVPLTENNFKWKEGFVAPPEKCQIDISMIDTIEDVYGQRRSSFSKYPGSAKRMMASSRHLMNLQKKGNQQESKPERYLVPPSSV